MVNPQNRQRYGAGPHFEKEYTTAGSLLAGVNYSGLGKKKGHCADCGKALNLAQGQTRTFTKEITVKGMKPFTLKVTAPMVACSNCQKLHVLNMVELEKAETQACENGNLCWDAVWKTGAKHKKVEKSAPPLEHSIQIFGSYWTACMLWCLTFVFIPMAAGQPLLVWMIGIAAALATALVFFSFTQYNHMGIRQGSLFARGVYHPWDRLVTMHSQTADRKRGFFLPMTYLKFEKSQQVILSQIATRDYLGVISDIDKILKTLGHEDKVDSITKLMLKGKAFKGRIFPFGIVYFFVSLLALGSFIPFEKAWTLSRWTPTAAQVQNSSLTVSHSSRNRTYYWNLTLGFVLPNGKTITAQKKVEGLYVDDWHVGKNVDILYDPSNPENVSVGDFEVLSKVLLGIGLMGMALFLFHQASQNLVYFYFGSE